MRPSYPHLRPVLALALATAALSAHAGLYDYSTASNRVIPGVNNQGWVDSGLYGASRADTGIGYEDSYYAGETNSSYVNFAGWFLTIPSTEVAVAATVTLPTSAGEDGFFYPGTFTARSLTRALLTDLLDATGTPSDQYAQILTGTSYGSVNVTSTASTVLTLNAAGLAAINASKSGLFGFGGSTDGGLFDFSNGQDVRLAITTQAVPEPASFLVLGLPALALLRRRK